MSRSYNALFVSGRLGLLGHKFGPLVATTRREHSIKEFTPGPVFALIRALPGSEQELRKPSRFRQVYELTTDGGRVPARRYASA